MYTLHVSLLEGLTLFDVVIECYINSSKTITGYVTSIMKNYVCDGFNLPSHFIETVFVIVKKMFG